MSGQGDECASLGPPKHGLQTGAVVRVGGSVFLLFLRTGRLGFMVNSLYYAYMRHLDREVEGEGI